MNTRNKLKQIAVIALMMATVGCSYAPDEYAFWRSQPLTADDIFLQEPADIKRTATKSEQQVSNEPQPVASVVQPTLPTTISPTAPGSTESDDKRIGSVEIRRSTPTGEIEEITSRAVPVESMPPSIEPMGTPIDEIIQYNEGRAFNSELKTIQRRLLRDHTYAYIDSHFTRYVEPIDVSQDNAPLIATNAEGRSVYAADLESDAYPVEEQIANSPEIFLPPNIIINDNIIGPRDHVKEKYVYGLSRAPADWPREYEVAEYDFGSDQPAPTVQPFETLADGSIIINNLNNVSVRAGSVETMDGKKFYFSHGSARLSDSERAQLKKIAESMKLQSGPITIVGHASKPAQVTDPIKKRMLNLVMSEKRATEMAQALTSFGIEAQRINLYAFGDSYPNLLPRPGQKQEAADRRAVVVY